MAAIQAPLHQTTTAIYKAYEDDTDDGFRPHLGASLIGHDCHRYLWLTFRWASKAKFEGRMLRLFETGQLEEVRMIRNLKRIGVEVHDVDPAGKQWRVSSYGGHLGGSMDAAGRGFPEAPASWSVIEFKTHNEKSFKELQAKGVKIAKPRHWAQMTLYMGLTGMRRAAYLAVNKNTDELYFERVEFDKLAFDALMVKARTIIFADTPPPRIRSGPEAATYYECRYCDYKDLCHGSALPEVTCRSCAHSTPEQDGRWSCARGHSQALTVEQQKAACGDHRYIPIAAENFATVRNADDKQNWLQYELRPEFGGGTFVNGPTPGLSSAELRAVNDKRILGHPVIEEMRSQFSGTRLLA